MPGTVLSVGAADYTDRAAEFRRTRTPPPAVVDEIGAALGELVPAGLPSGPALDVGAGPGTFTQPLVAWLGRPVMSVEPSVAMRDEAVAAGTVAVHPYVAGVAEALPLRTGVASAAWLSTVAHQLVDPVAALRELRRVLAPHGVLVVRNLFADVPVTGLLGLVPGVDRAAAHAFPATGTLLGWADAAGLSHRGTADVAEPWTVDADVWVSWARSMRDTDSLLRWLDPGELDAGIAAVEGRHGAGGAVANPLTLRLVVFEAQA